VTLERAKSRVQLESERLLSHFISAGATLVETDVLLPAETLLDLYGEDIRARAYVTNDPLRGEMMLRPDFTVPIVQSHIRDVATLARYTYAGPVWRKQGQDRGRKSEYPQVGFEVFGEEDAASADAEVFALFESSLADLPIHPITGDMGLIFAAIENLDTDDRRKTALRRHVWRPEKFKRLLYRYSSKANLSVSREKLFEAYKSKNVEKMLENSGKFVGLRSIDEVFARVETLYAGENSDRISEIEVKRITDILDMSCTFDLAADQLLKIAPELVAAANKLSARAKALDALGVDIANLRFEAAYGRKTLEYYDGFVFGFYGSDPALSPVAQGGRYDAMTSVLGDGTPIPAVGGIVRPETVLELRGGVQ